MSTRRLWLLPVVFLLALVAATSANAGTPGRKIVVFRQGIDARGQEAAVRAAGGLPIKAVRLVNGTVAELNANAARALAQRPDVLRVDDDAVVDATVALEPPDVQAEYNSRAPGLLKKRTPTPTPMPTLVPTATSTSAPTSTPTAVPTTPPSPTATPTSAPTIAPSPTPTLVPTVAPSPTPTTMPTVAPSPTPVSSTEVVPWGISRINAPQAWSTSSGDSVKVGVVDTGISISHPDIIVSGGVSEVTYTSSYDDDNGHGSHVSGTIAALDNTYGVIGTGPRASLFAIKVLNNRGSGYISDIINGLDWAMANGIQVINMSLGTSSDVQSFHDAVIRTYNAGIVLVAAAGNSGPAGNTVNYPAAYSEVIAVSAIDVNNNIASFSSRGPQVDLAAPGVSVYSTYSGTSYATLSGTSMASPHVAGTAALRKKLHPAETAAQIAAVLKANAGPLPGLTADQQGSGLVDAYRVVTAPS